VQEFHVTLGCLDGDDISVKALDGWEDVIEVGIAEVGMSLKSIRDAGGTELEGINGPFEVTVPVYTTEGKLIY
jgi:hypothetical protein